MASHVVAVTGLPRSMELFALHLLLTSSILGFSRPTSWTRAAAFPLISYCVYGIISEASHEMRTRWTALVGGLAFISYLQYIDVALLSRWSYETHRFKSASTAISMLKQEKPSKHASIWARFGFGLNTMLSLRHVNTPYEVRGVAPFSTTDPSYVPTRSSFLIRRVLSAVLCYLVLDLMDAKPAPTSVDELFDPATIPLFSRLGEVTGGQLKLRIFSVVGFTITFYCITQGFYAVISVLAIGSGMSRVEDWKPMFGSLSDACTLRGFWGKYWHQCLRQSITSPAIWLSEKVLAIPHKSVAHRYTPLIFAFLVSAIMHTAANLSSGQRRVNLGVPQFFITQAAGIIFEDQVRSWYRYLRGVGKHSAVSRALVALMGYTWVIAFAVWSAPVWIYPIARSPIRQGPPNLLPYSVIKAVRG